MHFISCAHWQTSLKFHEIISHRVRCDQHTHYNSGELCISSSIHNCHHAPDGVHTIKKWHQCAKAFVRSGGSAHTITCMNVKFREKVHVSPAALANFMKFQSLFWLGKFRYEFREMDGQAKCLPWGIWMGGCACAPRVG